MEEMPLLSLRLGLHLICVYCIGNTVKTTRNPLVSHLFVLKSMDRPPTFKSLFGPDDEPTSPVLDLFIFLVYIEIQCLGNWICFPCA